MYEGNQTWNLFKKDGKYKEANTINYTYEI